MFISCPSCSSRYNVPANSLPPEGRVVRCGQCSHVWTEFPPSTRPPATPDSRDNFGIEEPRRLYEAPAKRPSAKAPPKKPAKAAKPPKVKGENIFSTLTKKQRISLLAGVMTWAVILLIAISTSDGWIRYLIPVTATDDAMRMMAVEGINSKTAGGHIQLRAVLINKTQSDLKAPALLVSVRSPSKDVVKIGRIVLQNPILRAAKTTPVKADLVLPEGWPEKAGDVLIEFESDPEIL